jgi:hypothetical protein
VVPASDASPLHVQAALEGPESGFAFMRLRQSKRGRTVPQSVVIRDTAGERRLRRRGEDWLAGAKV